MIAKQLDGTHDSVTSAVNRIDAAFQRRPVMPLQSLQYRLGETGQPRHQVEARLLKRIMNVLTHRGRRAKPLQPWEVDDDLFAGPDLTAREARAAARECHNDLQVLATADWDTGFEAFAAAVAEAMDSGIATVPPHRISPARLAGSLEIPGFEARFRSDNSGGSPVDLWICHEPSWLHPDDPRLWAFLLECLDLDSRPLILARRFHPAAFALFEFLRIRGLQTHSAIAPEQNSEELTEAAGRIGWFFVTNMTKLREKGPLGSISSNSAHMRASSWDPRSRDALLDAQATGLMESTSGTATRLAEWTEHVDLRESDLWMRTVRRWVAWEAEPSSEFERATLLATSAKKRAPERRPSATKPATASPPEAPLSSPPSERRGYGRETTITRVPFRIR